MTLTHVKHKFEVQAFGTYGYLDLCLPVRTTWEARFVARRWLRIKNRYDKEEIDAVKNKLFKKGRAFNRGVSIAVFRKPKYAAIERCHKVVFKRGDEVHCVLFVTILMHAKELRTAWLVEHPENFCYIQPSLETVRWLTKDEQLEYELGHLSCAGAKPTALQVERHGGAEKLAKRIAAYKARS